MATVNLTKENFDEVVGGNDIVLIDFWAAWCGPCRTFAPVYEAASEKFPNIVFGKVDTEDQPELAGAFQVRSIPTLVAFREQIGIFSQPGALPQAALEDLIAQISALDMDDVRQKVAEQKSSQSN